MIGHRQSVNPAAASLRADFPLLWEKAEQCDYEERSGGCTDPLLMEIERAMHELWLARSRWSPVVPEYVVMGG